MNIEILKNFPITKQIALSENGYGMVDGSRLAHAQVECET